MQTIKRIKYKSLHVFSTTWMNSLTDLCLLWDPHIGHHRSITSNRDTLIVVSWCHLLVPCPVPNNNYVSWRVVMLICLIKKSMCSPLHTCVHCPLKHWGILWCPHFSVGVPGQEPLVIYWSSQMKASTSHALFLYNLLFFGGYKYCNLDESTCKLSHQNICTSRGQEIRVPGVQNYKQKGSAENYPCTYKQPLKLLEKHSLLF